MRRYLLAVVFVLMASPAMAAQYLGDFPMSASVQCHYDTNAATGASITKSTNGTLSVYKDGGLTQTTTGPTEDKDFDALTGTHLVTIATTDAFYVAGSEYALVLSAATIDGQVVNAVLCQWSIERKQAPPIIVAGTAVTKDATGVILTVPIVRTSGKPFAGIAFNTATNIARYCRPNVNGACVSITLTGTCTLGTFTSGCFLERDATLGEYELHVPDAAFATGVDRGVVKIQGVVGSVATEIPYELTVGLAAVATNVSSILADTGTDGVVVAAASKSPVGTWRKNVAGQRTHPVFFRRTSNPQLGVTGLGSSFTVVVMRDTGGFSATSGTKAEVADGAYTFTPSADDVNCDTCYFQATGSGGVPYLFFIFTTP